jgi:hypothetical protein
MPFFHLLVMAQVLVLLAVANTAPIIAKKLLGSNYAWPIDGGFTLKDGQTLFGSSKTVRGVIVALPAAGLAALLLGLDWRVGVSIAATSMAGDVFSSFVKRRMRLEPSSMALGLDQIPELTAPDVMGITFIFFLGEIIGARLFFALKIKDRPY